jgi:hypothetical protein
MNECFMDHLPLEHHPQIWGVKKHTAPTTTASIAKFVQICNNTT